MTVLDFKNNHGSRKAIHAKYILVALNMPAVNGMETLRNFHGEWPARDYKLRTAFLGTEVWGAYMTDILKNFLGCNANEVRANIRRNPQNLCGHFEMFKDEIEILGAQKSRFIALGVLTYDLVCRALGDSERVTRVTHYSHFIGECAYRKGVLQAIGIENMIA